MTDGYLTVGDTLPVVDGKPQVGVTLDLSKLPHGYRASVKDSFDANGQRCLRVVIFNEMMKKREEETLPVAAGATVNLTLKNAEDNRVGYIDVIKKKPEIDGETGLLCIKNDTAHPIRNMRLSGNNNLGIRMMDEKDPNTKELAQQQQHELQAIQNKLECEQYDRARGAAQQYRDHTEALARRMCRDGCMTRQQAQQWQMANFQAALKQGLAGATMGAGGQPPELGASVASPSPGVVSFGAVVDQVTTAIFGARAPEVTNLGNGALGSLPSPLQQIGANVFGAGFGAPPGRGGNGRSS